MKPQTLPSGKLDMIIGCMYASKTSTLLSKIRQHLILQKRILVLTHTLDTRSPKNSISTHDSNTLSATPLENLVDVFNLPEYAESETLFIEEAQFFEDLYEVVVVIVEDHGKHVVLCGLDGDFKRMPFRNVCDLIPFADSVEKKSALCAVCKDGTNGMFSKRVSGGNDRTLVGGIDRYIPVCRYHYSNDSNE